MMILPSVNQLPSQRLSVETGLPRLALVLSGELVGGQRVPSSGGTSWIPGALRSEREPAFNRDERILPAIDLPTWWTGATMTARDFTLCRDPRRPGAAPPSPTEWFTFPDRLAARRGPGPGSRRPLEAGPLVGLLGVVEVA